MNTLKTITLAAVMAAVAYGVFSSLNKKPAAGPPPEVSPESWATAPQVEVPGPGETANTLTPGAPPGLGTTPQFVPSGPFGPEYGAPGSPGAAAAPVSMPSAATPPTGSPFDNGPPTTTALPGNAPVAGNVGNSAPSRLPPATQLPGAAPPATLPGTNYPSTNPGTNDAAASALPGDDASEGYARAEDTSAGQPAAEDASQNSTQPPDDPEFHALFNEAMSAAARELDAGKLAEVHLALSQWYDHPQLSEAEDKQLVGLLNRLAGTVIYSHQHHLLESAYEVKPGDTLTSVAQAYQVPWQLLGKMNGLTDPSALRPGQKLKVLRGPFHARVDVQKRQMTLFVQDYYAGRFKIGVGSDQPAAIGEFQVVNKGTDPEYRQDRVIPGGDPSNPLGRYYINLGGGLGIHGTNDPNRVGQTGVPGCLCLAPVAIGHVFDILSVGSKVEIVGAAGTARQTPAAGQRYR